MKRIMQLLGISALLATAANAQTTNVVMVANIALTGFAQTSDMNAAAVRMTTRDVLDALNANGFNFSRNAKLVLLSQEDQLPTFAIRDKTGTNATTTDISSFFFIDEATEVHANNNLKSYAAQTFNFDNQNGTSFSVSGLTALQRGRVTGQGVGPLSRVTSLSSQVSGYGTLNGTNMVVRGTVTAGSAKAEID